MNIFDLIIVILSLIELHIKIRKNSNNKSSIISCLRILQFFRYLYSFDFWKKLQIIITSMIYTAFRMLDFFFSFY